MRLTNDDIDYETLLNISQELGLVVAMAVGEDWHDLSNQSRSLISTLDWAAWDINKAYADELRRLAAICLYLLFDIEEKRHNESN